ncbi:MAG: sporulation protein YtaF [Firmicutes bacterium]|nr:sporulation protein YtaF [Bacillota bacterium]
MNSLFWSLVFALAANLDNLGVGIAYGINKIKIPPLANLTIAVISFSAAWLSATVGQAMSLYCLNPEFANLLGAILLCIVGLWVIFQPIITACKMNRPMEKLASSPRRYVGPTEILRCPENADMDNSRDVSYWEAVLLGLALSINALAGGFDAGTIGISALFEAALIGLVSLLTISAGCFFGKKYASDQLGKYATVVSGSLLIMISMHQLWG